MKRVVLQHLSLNRVISYQVEEGDEHINFHARHFDTSEDGTTSSSSMKSMKTTTMLPTMKKSATFGLSPPSESRIMLRRWKQPVNRAILRESESSSGSSSCSSPLPSPASGHLNPTQLS